MDSTTETPEVRPRWVTILREQGRTMSWLSLRTGKSYPAVAKYATGERNPSQAWLDKVAELLGEPVS